MNNLKKKAGLTAAVIALVLILGALAGCQAQKQDSGKAAQAASQKVDYPAKDITFIVPVSPGGGFDTLARALAPFLREYLPNKPNIIVKNVPGGGWAIGINEVYNARPDGYVIGFFNIPSNVISQVLGMAKYDLLKIVWIGNVSSPPNLAAISPKSKYRTLQDMQKAPEVRIATTGLGSSMGLGALMTAEEMKIKPRFVNSKGSSESVLATIRGDVDLIVLPYASIKEYVETEKLIPVWVYDKKRLSNFPNLPTVVELLTDNHHGNGLGWPRCGLT
ncbi:MAG: tripartite tricarboxylate transporter substrate binding protein [Firmicutes bacterium]|nr:tripartite tricarboxylate transporter substrate binding protein [Bacillota bacterium]